LKAFDPGRIERGGRERRTRAPLAMSLSRYPDFSAYSIREQDGVEIFLPTEADRGPAPGEGEDAARRRDAPARGIRSRGGPHRQAASSPQGAWLGIDIGSTSTKAVLIAPDRRILGGFYTATAGRPIEAVRKLLRAIDGAFAGLAILGAATTGSGRQIVRELFRADLAVNEISAHARAAVFLHPEADTIIEIGGQDSKLTLLRGGEVYFSTMNYVCAAGTGSFIEEQARRIEVSLADFSDLAFGAEAPYTSDRCTVYMERDLNALLAEGWSREALAAAVLNSVRDNYLAKVVNRTPLGRRIVFQGATARNRALVAAFEQLLGQPIHVSPYCHLTGALGAALICQEKLAVERRAESAGPAGEAGGAGLAAAVPGGEPAKAAASPFIRQMEGFEVTEEICRRCANHCPLTVAERDGRKSGWGMKCGREYGRRRRAEVRPSAAERRFGEVFAGMMEAAPGGEPAGAAGKGGSGGQEAEGAATGSRAARNERAAIRIGIPRALYNVGYAPLWCDFLRRLGFRVDLSDSRRETLEAGKGLVNSDFCAPMVLAHGAAKQLLDRGCDYLFYPAVVNEKDPDFDGEMLFKRKTRDAYYCYYSQYLPTIVNKLTGLEAEPRLISPLVYFNHRSLEENAAEIHRALAAKLPPETWGSTEEETREALRGASEEFRRRRKAWAATLESELEREDGGKTGGGAGGEGGSRPNVLLLCRPYVLFNPVMNLGLPALLEQEGARLFWQEELDLEGFQPIYAGRYYERMHWQYGQQILKAAEYCARRPNLFAVYLTCFRCSPDSFLLSYVKDIVRRYGKPFLILQLDEHGSGVGYATRIEAALESFRNHLHAGKVPARPLPTRARNDALREGDTVLVPQVDPVTSSFWAACFRRAGYDARLLDPDEKTLNTGYQFTNGGECLPLVSLIGGAIDKVREEGLDPAKTFFYLPTLCLACNFPSFPILSDLAFESAGLEGLKIGLINIMAPGDVLPQALSIRILESNIVGGILTKLFHRVLPYEVRRGDAGEAFRRSGEAVIAAILGGGDLRSALAEAVERFRAVPRDESGGRRPRIGLLGDLYVKFNDLVNGRIQDLVRELGGELVVPSWSEYPFHFYDADVRLYGDDPRHFRLLKTIEKRYERQAGELLAGQEEPDFAECVRCLEEYGVTHYLTGETSINVGRALYLIRHRLVEAILHLNPMFCCPGVVSASIYRKIQQDFGVPIIDIFYDGTGNPNRVLIPHLHYLQEAGGSRAAGEAGGRRGRQQERTPASTARDSRRLDRRRRAGGADEGPSLLASGPAPGYTKGKGSL
jgi:predicted CoA-substrate-specific enzyme activase